MKFNGRKLAPRTSTVVLPRPDGDLVIKAAAVLNYDDFDKLCPQPEPPSTMRPGGAITQNPEDPKYREAVNQWSARRIHWMVLTSLQATPDIEWETVDMADPATWENYEKEMAESGLSPVEINAIVECVTEACGLNQSKIDEATKAFLAGAEAVPASG